MVSISWLSEDVLGENFGAPTFCEFTLKNSEKTHFLLQNFGFHSTFSNVCFGMPFHGIRLKMSNRGQLWSIHSGVITS